MTAMSTLPVTLPADWYHDPMRYSQERNSIFGREWLWYSPESVLMHPGAYLARDYAGWPLMVVRAPDGTLCGFHNVCRHRAGPLLADGEGTCTNLVCKYHGWAYGFDGQLRSARDFGTELDPVDFALWPLRVEIWRGQVFVNLSSTGPTLHDDLGEFVNETSEFAMEGMTLVSTLQHDLACNWKTYADNYLEGYHVPLVHPQLNRQIDAKRYRVDLGDRYCRHSAPPRSGSTGTTRWLFRWPNLALNLYGDAMNIEVVVPTGPTTCTVLYNHFFVDPDAAEIAGVVHFSNVLMEEDRHMVEAVQRNLESGRYDVGVLSSRHENGVLQFHDLVRGAGE